MLKYLTDYYDKKIEFLKRLNADCNIAFMTDNHNNLTAEKQTNGVKSIGYLIDKLDKIDAIVCGGDIGNDYSWDREVIERSYVEIMDAYYSLDTEILCCIGNHDDATGHSKNSDKMIELTFLPDQLHKIMQRNFEGENYFYYDLCKAKLRIICLNTSDIPYIIENDTYKYNSFDTLMISDKQLNWLKDSALDTDYKIMVFSHAPLINDNIKGTTSEPVNGRGAFEILKEHGVIALFAGHVHYDNLVSNEGVNMITTLSAYSAKYADSPERVIGSYSETAFDIISIKENQMYLTRFGAGEDRLLKL